MMAPEFYAQFKLDDLNRQRNHYAHTKQKFTDSQIREMASGFVKFTLAAWCTNDL